MGTSPLSPEDIRAAAGAHHELGTEYGDAVVASFLDRVDREIAARVDERLAARMPRRPPAETENRRTLMKGFALGVAASVAVVFFVAGARPGHHALLLLPLMAAIAGVFAAGAHWASRRRASRGAAPRQGPHAAGGDYSRI
jgi:hypothetical protein